jgi:hypothetical protein
MLSPAESLSLSVAFDPSIAEPDLVFQYRTANGPGLVPGTITYVVGEALAGDLDCDGDVDFDDIDEFVLGLNNPQSYLQTFGLPSSLKGDTDSDGDLDFDDIPGFVAILSAAGAGTNGVAAAVPEPSTVCLLGIVLLISGARRGMRFRRQIL